MNTNSFILPSVILGATLVSVGCAHDTLPWHNAHQHRHHPVARVTYACDNGLGHRVVRYPDNRTARVPYQGKHHKLSLAMSADGARYTGDDIVWWSKGSGTGSTATLYQATSNSAIGNKIAGCHEIKTSRSR